ncbi:MAG: winged helix-turn-helix transcriptional regulator [Candidatus Thermoplasmatota archaeon]|nr:winged helix-turn-helix transcriptional regulator [Candidatus Thermoplasmatota archaeon]
MKGERLGEHRTRDRILRSIIDDPGISLSEIADKLSINEGTLRYHIDILLGNGSIISRKEGRRRMFFGSSAKVGTVVRSDRRPSRNEERMIDIITFDPGVTVRGIGRMLDLSRKEISSILGKLERRGSIWKVRTDRGVGYERATEKKVMDRIYLELVRMFLDGLIDEERFLAMKQRLDNRTGRT